MFGTPAQGNLTPTTDNGSPPTAFLRWEIVDTDGNSNSVSLRLLQPLTPNNKLSPTSLKAIAGSTGGARPRIRKLPGILAFGARMQ